MNKFNYLYYTNDPNELLRRDREFQIHQQKLYDIKRSKSSFTKTRKTSKNKNSFNMKTEQHQIEIYQQNKYIAFSLAKIHNRQSSISQHINQSQYKPSHSKERIKGLNLKIVDENINLCKRIIDQQSQIDFKQKQIEFKQHQFLKKRLLRVRRQIEQQEKIQCESRTKSKSSIGLLN